MSPATSRNVALSAALFAVTLVVAGAQSSTYKIDQAHSEADFTIRHLAISNVHGHFGNIAGTVLFDDKDVAKSSVDASIDVSTVDTGVPQRDGHLKSADFFDAAKFPTMTFKSRTVTRASDGFDLLGDLTLHGVTRPVTLHVVPSKEQTGMDGKSLLRGFEATTTLHRQDFGLVWAGTVKSGDAVLGDDVKVDINLEGSRPLA